MNTLIAPAWRIPVLTIITIAGVSLVIAIVGRMHASRLLSDIDLAGDSKSNIEIMLSFEPERFHLEKFQEVGRYQGWADGRAVILDAQPSVLRKLARSYWVDDVMPHEVSQ